jgi:hypothetical protein
MGALYRVGRGGNRDAGNVPGLYYKLLDLARARSSGDKIPEISIPRSSCCLLTWTIGRCCRLSVYRG